MFISSLSAFPESLLTFFSSSHNTIAVSPLRQHVGEVRRISHSPAPSSARLFPCNLHKHPPLCGITWNNWNNVYFLTYIYISIIYILIILNTYIYYKYIIYTYYNVLIYIYMTKDSIVIQLQYLIKNFIM